MPLVDTGYHEYEGTYRGVWYRRAVITASGLRACLANQWMKRLITLAWALVLAQVTALFFIGQLLVEESFVFALLEGASGFWQSIFGGIKDWLYDRPEESVHFVYNFLFFQFATKISFISFIALAIAIPHLITTDLASRALLVYSSKAVNRFDYLIGKFGVAFGLLSILWLGPVIVAWTVGNLLAPDWKFFMYSRDVLLNAVCYVVVSMTVLSLLALGISAISSKEKSTGTAWILIWVFGNAFEPLGRTTAHWLQNLSISYNVDQLALHFFKLRQDLFAAVDAIPMLGRVFDRMSRRVEPFFMREAELGAAAVALGVMVLVAAIVIWRRVKPE